jgi:hypothetical protein
MPFSSMTIRGRRSRNSGSMYSSDNENGRRDRRQHAGNCGAIARSSPERRSGDPVDPGHTGGSLIVRRVLDDASCRAEVDGVKMDKLSLLMLATFGNAHTSDRQERARRGGPLLRLVVVVSRFLAG